MVTIAPTPTNLTQAQVAGRSAVTFGTEALFTTLQNIKFSDLRREFTSDQPGFGTKISASDLIRHESRDIQRPIVPDSIRNKNVPNSKSNWKVSGFQNTYKYYNISLTVTSGVWWEARLDNPYWYSGIDLWNGDQNRNIRTKIQVLANAGALSNQVPALYILGPTCNFIVINEQNASGYGGRGGGTWGSNNGENGGSAMLIYNTDQKNLRIRNNGIIAGGGGGGERGKDGVKGSDGKCYYYSGTYTNERCGCCPSCNGKDRNINNAHGGGWCRLFTHWWYIDCERYQKDDVSGGAAGIGGNGGLGWGIDGNTGRGPTATLKGTSGVSFGTEGEKKNCRTAGYEGVHNDKRVTSGTDGGHGGKGGDAGQNGGSANPDNPDATPGSAGAAIGWIGDFTPEIIGYTGTDRILGTVGRLGAV